MKFIMDMDGTMRPDIRSEDYPDMMIPCLCSCGKVFDLCGTEMIHRYTDCSVFKLPCCGRITDDRPAGWKSGPNYKRLT